MSNLCNCSNCPHFGKAEYDRFCSKHEIRIESIEVGLIETIGCLSHPDARAYLMRDVIEELERLEVESFDCQEIMAYERAISLIKGVK